jgi:hypothetical protein
MHLSRNLRLRAFDLTVSDKDTQAKNQRSTHVCAHNSAIAAGRGPSRKIALQMIPPNFSSGFGVCIAVVLLCMTLCGATLATDQAARSTLDASCAATDPECTGASARSEAAAPTAAPCSACLTLLVDGSAEAAGGCFQSCIAQTPPFKDGSQMMAGSTPETTFAAPCQNEAALVVTQADVGAVQKADRSLVLAVLQQIPLERWTARATPRVAAQTIRPVIGLLHHRDEVVHFLREYMLSLWAAECYSA